VLGRIAEAEARPAQEKKAQQQAAEAARLARERDQKITALIAKARKAKKPGDALGFLEEAQRLDPQRTELAALIAQRQAELARKSTTPIPPAVHPDVSTPGVAVPERKTGTPLSPALLGGIGAVVILLVVGIWYFLREPTPPPPDPDKPPVVVDRGRTPGGADRPGATPSSVTIVTEPWTNVTLTPARGGKPETCTTPCQLQLLPGEYELAFENGGITQPHTEALSVPAGQPVDVRRKMPGFDVDRAVTSIVGR
jgi:hypothetical protein